MDIFEESHSLNRYITAHASAEDPLLEEIRRFTYLNVVAPNMLSGHVQGKFLELISRLIRPSRILEIGTYTGYSAICMARGLKEDGKLITFEINDELNEISSGFFRKAGLEHKIERINGDAREIIPGLSDTFDLAFIDGEKEEYIEYYKLVMEKLSPNGIIIADNVLWYGKVLDPGKNPDSATRGIEAFNTYVTNDPAVENFILPLRDGLMMVRKKEDGEGRRTDFTEKL